MAARKQSLAARINELEGDLVEVGALRNQAIAERDQAKRRAELAEASVAALKDECAALAFDLARVRGYLDRAREDDQMREGPAKAFVAPSVNTVSRNGPLALERVYHRGAEGFSGDVHMPGAYAEAARVAAKERPKPWWQR